MAQIAVMRDGKSVLRESKTFDRKPAATAWIKKREAELQRPGGLTRPKVERSPTLADALGRYVEESNKQIGKTKAQVLGAIKRSDLAATPCSEIASQDIVAYARSLGAGRQAQTVQNYLSHLGAVFAIARPAWGYPLDSQAMDDAMKVAKRLGLIAKSTERDRRPTLGELDSLMNHFVDVRRRRPASIPMTAICAFAIFSTRRQEEITRILWSDLDDAAKRIKVRNMKNPGQKIGNDVLCDLPPEARRIIKAMPKVDDKIFPFDGESISAAFTRACKFLGIDNLHFHDLRHDGVSRLFEMGWTIPQAASVSGHRSWSSLKRYAHLREAGDKYAGWPWLEIVASVS